MYIQMQYQIKQDGIWFALKLNNWNGECIYFVWYIPNQMNSKKKNKPQSFANKHQILIGHSSSNQYPIFQ